ncbi:heliorhodopsin HeR [Micromonospora sp. C31]|uniref:heliorhodopsin HeR n=1 Tax=Micromonospora sp. C31 TaxID=2824876 RepID=UPI001B399B1F|nr:heliorhodopsin HeR [Micromonospora sp. C31]MBQ1074611.1 heliorhodopsin HeR [Micromonospora sp. C31]
MGRPTAAGRDRYRRLRGFNVLVGLILAVEGGWMWAASNDLSLPITASYLTADPTTLRDATLPEVAFRLAIGPAVAVFLLLAALDHLVTAAPGVHPWYARNLDRRSNYARWIEYSVSASIMIVLIGLFVGIRDLAAVIGIFGANTAMILFGLLMERQQVPGRADWSAFWFGSLVGLAPWAAIAVYVAQPPEIPGFVWAIIVIQFLLFASFALNMALQYAQRGRWRDYRYGEVSYILLSLVAKSALAWLIYANVLRT